MTQIFMIFFSGINCRWGMAGNVAEAHYDGGRNWIVLLGGGQRRYILGHPRECPNLALYPVGHPSGRHSAPNWSEIGKLPRNQSPAARALSHAQVTQVVLQASDALFLPVSGTWLKSSPRVVTTQNLTFISDDRHNGSILLSRSIAIISATLDPERQTLTMRSSPIVGFLRDEFQSLRGT